MSDTRWRLAAEDLQALAWLHVQERDTQALQTLAASGFPASLSLLPADHPAVCALQAALLPLEALAISDEAQRRRCDDDLAADYAAIYLTNSLRASPYESVWRDDDQLIMQEPTFAVRAFYRRHGMAVPDWRCMPDDHIAHQLNFIAHLLAQGEPREAARFMQQHLLVWLQSFAEAVALRARTRVYVALAGLTLACCEALRERLPAVTVMPPLVAPARQADDAANAGAGCGAG